jgi:GNAT superfamily N-acetyltransferase
MDKYIFEKAIVADIDRVLELVQKRIKWMDEHDISQWNKTNYLECYPRMYFEEMVSDGRFYVLRDIASNNVVGAVTLLDVDPRWNNDAQSYYIHNLVSDTEFSGAGTYIINYCEKLALKNGKNKIRLDCQASNQKLNEYYEELGYKFVGTVQDGHYIGNKREKELNEKV